VVESFVTWQRAHGSFPIVGRDGEAVFFYVAANPGAAVRMVGEFALRSPTSVQWDGNGEAMAPVVPGGAAFARRMRFEPDARLEYQFVVDGKPVNDPFNTRTAISGAAPNAGKDGAPVSVLIMREYRRTSPSRPGVPRGRTVSLDEPWATPKVAVYLPPGYTPTRRYPTLYVADGGAWARINDLPLVLDSLVADRVIEPIIAVLIDPTEDRAGWYNFDSGYLPYLDKVVAWVDDHLATRASAAARVHMGSSAGGRATLSVALQRPELFANAALFSPSLIAPPHYFEPYLTGRKRLPPLKVWLCAGNHEGYIYEDAHMFERLLVAAGTERKVIYTHEGHSLTGWRNLTGDMLAFFFGGAGTSVAGARK
jgi:enterochelin esterase-like enzyme